MKSVAMALLVLSACLFSPPALAQVWEDYQPTNLLAPKDFTPIGGKARTNGFPTQVQSIRYGQSWLPPTATSSVNISVTSGLGGFDLSDEQDAAEFMDFSRRPDDEAMPAPSDANNWYDYKTDQGL